MKQLSPEERTAKFQAKPNNNVGLRSRGHKKLTPQEQRDLFESLGSQKGYARLESLRILREAIQSTSSPRDVSFELKVYEESVRESINQQKFEILPHILAHITEISASTFWNTLLVISLSNTKQYHKAFSVSTQSKDRQYTSSLALKDYPLWASIVDQEKDKTTKSLMEQARKELETYNLSLIPAYRGTLKTVSSG